MRLHVNPRTSCLAFLFSLAVLLSGLGPRVIAGAAEDGRAIIEASGVKGGLIVHVGCGDGSLTASLRRSSSFQVQGLDPDAENVAKARRQVQALGLYGDVSIDRLAGKQLPYVDNLVNLVVSEDLGGISMEEVLRVLAPHGVAYIRQGDRWTKTVKPRPDEIDEWTHYLHDASGNAVAHDTVVGPPRHLQWIGSPRWSRHHDRMASMSALVSSGGRIFYIMDEGSRVSIQLPPKWTLVARDGFNGTILWKQPIETWHSHLWPLKSGPTQLARRLVAVDDRVYVTLGLQAPLTALDAASGEVVRVFEGTGSTEEVIFADGTLYLLVNKGESELTRYAPAQNVGDQQRVGREFLWNELPREIHAIDAQSGRVKWRKTSRVAPLTLVAQGSRVLFHDGEKILCLDAASGNEEWTAAQAARRPNITMNFGPRLVAYGDVVLFAGGNGQIQALSAKSGQQLWEAPHAHSAYASPEDLLIVGGLVWSAPTTRSQDSGFFTGRDALTGRIRSEFAPDVETYWFHHRCYIAKATDRFLLPSRTGIEFVDYKKEHWDINHWVRGGCLYGIMPCNGLVYTPPHDCACYPETKLYGFNALAPESPSRQIPREVSDRGRLERGPAYDAVASRTPAGTGSDTDAADWPTYRRDAMRSGFTRTGVPSELTVAWETKLGERLTSPVIAAGILLVAQPDAHTVHALDAASGQPLWNFTAGGRVDSPPTVSDGRCVFGSADGYVYCLKLDDGSLAWRFRAAPVDLRLTAFEQLESVWPVHGSVLVQDGSAYFVAGRSNFLDGGLRWFKLDLKTGDKLAEVIIDERDPETGENLQERLQILNMPVGLPDILSSDGQYVFMRSQRFDLDGNRRELGPQSGQPAEQGSAQHGEGPHLFAPMGMLDDTWFHRSYWVYGRSFAGGHAGYYQAGKYAPAGRILAFDEANVYGFGRKPEYYRWTTILEHQLFSVPKEPPEVAGAAARSSAPMIRFAKSASLNPTGKSLAVEAWVNAERPNGVVLARGGPQQGYALLVNGGRPQFAVRADGAISSVSGEERVVGKWVHLTGVLSGDKQLQLYVNGKLAATAKAQALISSDPAQSLEIGADDGGAVGNYTSPNAFTGTIDEVRIYHGELSAEDVAARYANPKSPPPRQATLVLACSFDNADAVDVSGNKNDGQLADVQPAEGKIGGGMRLRGGTGNRAGGSFLEPHWTADVPLFVRAMVLADKTLFVAGPPDVVDEAESFQLLVGRSPQVQAQLARQAAALEGQQGAILRAVSASDGATLAELKLDSPPSWDGMAAARGQLFLTTEDGRVLALKGK